MNTKRGILGPDSSQPVPEEDDITAAMLRDETSRWKDEFKVPYVWGIMEEMFRIRTKMEQFEAGEGSRRIPGLV